MRKTLLCVLFLLAPSLSSWAEDQLPQTSPEICEQDLRLRLTWLASDELRGRDAISEDAARASAWIAESWQRLGLRPLGTDGTWFQPLVIQTPVLREGNQLVTRVSEDERSHAVESEWNPFSISATGSASGPVVFCGYGIHAPEQGYDDFAGIDVKGKVLLVLRKNPGWPEVRHAAFLQKLKAAADRGAAALLLCNDPQTTQGKEDRIGHWSAALGAPAGSSTIPYAFIQQDVARRLLAPTGKSLEELEAALRSQGPQSMEIAQAHVTVRTEVGGTNAVNARNVIGFLPGRDPDVAEQVVVIGAHFDHVGLGYFGSTGGPADSGQIHNGADDNGSGSVSLMELAEWFAQPAHRPRRSLLFIAFTGEERGLLGSVHYVEHPTVPLKDTVAMLNLDMVGRSQGGRLEVGGVGTARGLQDLVAAANQPHGLQISWDPGGLAPSDSTSFFRKNLPVLFFFTGLHKDYHRPTDDVELIEFPTMLRICSLVRDVAQEIAERDEALEFTKPPTPPRPPVLGVVPSPEPDTRGLMIREVAPGGPAAEGGMQEGDVLVGLAGQIIRDLDSLRAALRRLEPGKTVAVDVLRGEERITLKVTLGERGGRGG